MRSTYGKKPMNQVKYSQLPLFTQKEIPKDAAVTSHILAIKAGFIRKQSAGLYAYMPLGYEVYRKIENVIRKIMNRFGGIEVHMPILTNKELWESSGRWDQMGKEMMRMKDRHENEYALGPTHEEAIVWLAGTFLKSYKQLPLNLYQIGEKFRDEIRPRYGLIRSREFVMKDAYSFHEDEESLDKTYQDMRKAYREIFDELGIETIPVQADSGAMGGSGSEEFMVASEIGEETLLLCKNESCKYRSNQEKTEFIPSEEYSLSGEDKEPELISTPNLKTVNEVANFLNKDKKNFIKTLIYENEDCIVLAFIPGDREINEIKLSNYSGCINLQMAEMKTIHAVTGAEPGYAGPYNLPVCHNKEIEFYDDNEIFRKKKVKVLFDRNIKNRKDLVSGGNKTNTHYINLQEGRDFTIENSIDLVLSIEGDICPACKIGHLKETKGIEVGHIFKLGDKYTKSMNLTVLNEKGKSFHPLMGCYGIGLGRTMATYIEQNHDDNGIIWSETLSPFQFYYIGIYKTEEEKKILDSFYNHLCHINVSVYYDDRKETPGVKFNDADLVGFPYQIVLGKNFFKTNQIELKKRSNMKKISLTEEKFFEALKENTITELFID